MSTTQPPITLNDDSKELLRTLLEAPPSSLELLCTQLPDKADESAVALSKRAIDLVHTWSTSEKAEFIHGHPRIGEQSNLSALSAAEQARSATSPEVLERLRVLNIEYERRYRGLR
jgi:2-oxo-4-hydroxy-4-carboxy--5-ureidoimidazoline (OHCU) decarboxylase